MRDENGVEPQVSEEPQKERDLRVRLKKYSLRVIRLYESLPKRGAVHVISHQLVRSGTSPGAQYREACRAKSNADFISKVEGVLQELDESDYWLELLIDGGYVKETLLRPLRNETNELISIFVTIATKTKRNGRTITQAR